MIKAEFFRKHEGLGNGNHGNPQHHVVTDLGRLAVSGAAGMHNGLAHGLQHRVCEGESLIGTANHECQCSRFGAADAA